MGVSGWLAVAAAGGPLFAGVEVGVLGDVGVAGFVVEPALYIGVLCLYWFGKAEPPPAAAVVDSSGWRAACSVSRPEPPALAVEGIGEGLVYKELQPLVEQGESGAVLPTWLCLGAGNVRGRGNHAGRGW